jgi:hypothetical protein
MSSQPNNDTTTSEDRIVQSIYDHLVTSVCIDIASNMHELIKTGEIPISELKEPFSRQQIFPELYKDKDPAEIQEILDKYATEVPTTRTRKRKCRHNVSKPTTTTTTTALEKGALTEKDDDEDFKDTASEPEPPQEPTMQTRHSINHLDIWGRVPAKEPKQNCECQLCGRHVSTLRFASHLDKCMGLSTRPATGNPPRNSASMAT